MLLAGTAVVSAFDASSDRKVMDKMCRGFSKALLTKDISWFEKMSTPDFVAIDHGRTENRKQTLGEVKQMFGMMKSIDSASSHVVSCKSVGNKIIAVTESSMRGKMAAGKGKTAVMVDTSTQEETWVKGPHGWKIKVLKSLSEKATLDGKPFNPAG